MKFTFGNLPSIGWVDPVGKLVELAQLCEEEGLDRFGVSDWRFYHDCFVVMTACLQATTKLEVESLVTDPYVRHPSLTALAHATMDDLSHGRAILGIGAGVEQPTFWEYERKLPMTAVREAVEICRRMLAGETVTFQGREISVEGAKLDFTPFRRDLPILIAARGTRMLELAGELADIVHLASFFVNAGHHRENLAHVKRGAERAGRRMGAFEIDISMPCSVSLDRDGTPEECAERLRALQRELPEVTGVRIYAVPPAGKPLFDGYVDMVKGFGRVARLVNAGVASAGAPARSAVA